MFLTLLIAIIAGVTAGTFTGIIPGLHANLVSALIVSNLAVLLLWFDPLSLGCFLCALALTHTFVDIVPSLYFGAPDESLADGALPGHRLLLQGRGYEAVLLTTVGTFGALILAVILFPLCVHIIRFLYPIVLPHTWWLLCACVIWMLFKAESFFWACLVFSLGSSLGILVLDSPINQPLLPMLSGLFGASSLLLSLREKQSLPKISHQRSCHVKKSSPFLVLASVLAGFIAAFLPGLGSAQAGTLTRTLLWRLEDEETLILLGGINTVNFILSLAAMLAIQKGRNGVVITIKEFLTLDTHTILLLLCVCLIAGSLAVIFTLVLGRYGMGLLTKVPYGKMNLSVLLFVSILVIAISGSKGIWVYLTATSIGLIAPLKNVPRSFAMGCLITPVILFFLRGV